MDADGAAIEEDPAQPCAQRDAYELRGNCGFSFGDGCSPSDQKVNLFGGVKMKNRKERETA